MAVSFDGSFVFMWYQPSLVPFLCIAIKFCIFDEIHQNMQEFDVFEKISKNDRAKWHLYLDAVERANPSAPK